MEKILQVVPCDDYKLILSFNTGETRIFDAAPYLSKGDFVVLKQKNMFKQAYVSGGTVCWPGDLDIAPETLYDRSVLV